MGYPKCGESLEYFIGWPEEWSHIDSGFSYCVFEYELGRRMYFHEKDDKIFWKIIDIENDEVADSGYSTTAMEAVIKVCSLLSCFRNWSIFNSGYQFQTALIRDSLRLC